MRQFFFNPVPLEKVFKATGFACRRRKHDRIVQGTGFENLRLEEKIRCNFFLYLYVLSSISEFIYFTALKKKPTTYCLLSVVIKCVLLLVKLLIFIYGVPNWYRGAKDSRLSDHHPQNLNSDQCLISSYKIIHESQIKVKRMTEMITNQKCF